MLRLLRPRKENSMSEPIRVLHVFGALDTGGVANFVMNTYRSMDRTRVQYDFALSQGAAVMDEEAKSLGARLFYFDPTKNLIKNLNWVLTESGPFDAVHSHMFFYSGLILRCAKQHGVPIRIAHAHNAHTGESGSLVRRAYESGMRRMIRANATVMLGCSEKACRYVFGDRCMSDPRVSVLPDGIDCERFAFDEAERRKIRMQYGLGNRFVVGHVGHFNPAKNHEKILQVFAEVKKRRDDAALLLVGDGELEQETHARVHSMGLDADVIFAGAHQNVEDYYNAMDVFLFPSRYEGFGMAMVEAQANGLACVASDVVPEETNVTGRAVFLPLEASADQWVTALLSMNRHVALNNSLLKKYDINSVAADLASLYYRNM